MLATVVRERPVRRASSARLAAPASRSTGQHPGAVALAADVRTCGQARTIGHRPSVCQETHVFGRINGEIAHLLGNTSRLDPDCLVQDDPGHASQRVTAISGSRRRTGSARRWSLRGALILTAALALAVAEPAVAAPPRAQVWVTTPDGALKLSNRGSAEFRPGGSENLTISVDPSRTYQTMDGFGASITDSSAHVLYGLDRRTRDADDEAPLQPDRGQRPVVPAPADGRFGLRGRRLLHLRRPAAGPDGLRHEPLLDRARPCADPAAAAPGAGAQPAAEGDRLPLEPAGVDEDERVADRRAADRRSPHLRRLRALLRQVRPGATSAPACRCTP